MKLIKLLLRILLVSVTIIYLLFTALTLWTWGELDAYTYIPIYAFIFGQFASAMILAFMAGLRYLFGEKRLPLISAEFWMFIVSFIALLVYMLSVLITWKS